MTIEQLQTLYDAMGAADREKAMAAAEAINPRLRAQLEQNPQDVLDVTAGLLQRAGRTADSYEIPEHTFKVAGAPAESGIRAPTLADVAGAALPIGAGIAGEKLAMKAAGPVLNRVLATSPIARLLATRGVQGVAGGAASGIPDAIRQRSAEPIAQGAALGGALVPGATLARRALPGGGAMRAAEAARGELGAFRQAMQPVTEAIPQAANRSPQLQQSLDRMGMPVTPEMRGAMTGAGMQPPAGLTALKGRGVEQLRSTIADVERQVGIGQRPAMMTPQEAGPAAEAAQDAVGAYLDELGQIGSPATETVTERTDPLGKMTRTVRTVRKIAAGKK